MFFKNYLIILGKSSYIRLCDINNIKFWLIEYVNVKYIIMKIIKENMNDCVYVFEIDIFSKFGCSKY